MFFDQSACLFALPSDVTVGGRHAISLCACVCVLHCDCGLWRVAGGERWRGGHSGAGLGEAFLMIYTYVYLYYCYLAHSTSNLIPRKEFLMFMGTSWPKTKEVKGIRRYIHTSLSLPFSPLLGKFRQRI